MIILGIIALIIARIVQTILWPLPSELSSPTNSILTQQLSSDILGGIFWGFVIGFYFVRYAYKIPLANAVYRGLIIDSLAILIASGLFTLLHLTDPATFFLTEVAYSIPSYSILGIVLGYSYTKFDSEKTIQSVRGTDHKEKTSVVFLHSHNNRHSCVYNLKQLSRITATSLIHRFWDSLRHLWRR